MAPTKAEMRNEIARLRQEKVELLGVLEKWLNASPSSAKPDGMGDGEIKIMCSNLPIEETRAVLAKATQQPVKGWACDGQPKE